MNLICVPIRKMKKNEKKKKKKKESPFFGVSKSNKMIRDVSKAFAKMRALIFG